MWTPFPVRSLMAFSSFGFVSQEPRQIFQRHPEKAYIALYFDDKNGSERKVALTDKIDDVIVKIEGQIRNGEKPSVSKEMTHYLSSRLLRTSPEKIHS